MAFVRLALRGDAEYHRINCAAIFCDEDEALPLPAAEADEAPLLTKAVDAYSYSHCEAADGEEMVHGIMPHHLKHATLAFNRKPKPRKGIALIQLRILKMDNTSFALAVPKNATVMEVKRILQNKFDSSGSNISWPHVWGNFCLSFNNQKLLDNGKQLQQLGNGDCNQLYFVRHVTSSSDQWGCKRHGFFTNMRKKRGLLVREA